VRVARSAILAALLPALAGAVRAAPIVSIDLDWIAPGSQPTLSTPLGSSIRVDVSISEVEVPGLREFELELAYDSNVLALDEVISGGFLSSAGDVWIYEVTPLPSGVHVLEVVRTFDYGASGAGDLLILLFDTVGVGESLLSLDGIALRPPLYPFVPAVPVGEVYSATVAVVPEPATGLLLGLGCAALALARRPTCRRA
jgi:hypothetical protein